MAGSNGIVDWNALSLNDGIDMALRILRQRTHVRLFAVTVDGESVDLTPPKPEVETVFDHFVETDARWGQGERRSTMVETRRRWTQELKDVTGGASNRDQRSIIVETSPGFSARIMPVRNGDGAPRAGIVAAGFIPDEKAPSRIPAIKEVMPDHLRDAVDVGEGPTLIRLPRADRRWIDHLIEAVASAVVEELSDGAPSLVDESATRFAGMVGASDAMRSVFYDVEKVADTDSTVLIAGENGTGKELVARAIHRLSPRRKAPFLAVNCAAIPGELIASELFGHVKGAFSGAHRDRQGLFEAADGGTLLLDEIGDMDQHLQTKLLRVLQEGTLVRVGDTEVRNVDVRLLCATNCDLEEMVQRGDFRRDLYFRIRVIELSIPPLRERRDDIELLANFFISDAAQRYETPAKTLGDRCLQQLINYDWPGNVRELENEIERLVIMSGDESTIEARWLRPPIANAEPDAPAFGIGDRNLPEAIELLERNMILDGLRQTGWNKAQTARDLGVSRRNLIRKVKSYELEQYRNDD